MAQRCGLQNRHSRVRIPPASQVTFSYCKRGEKPTAWLLQQCPGDGMVDIEDLKSSAGLQRAGSSPALGTT